jgi:hypothetical protein
VAQAACARGQPTSAKLEAVEQATREVAAEAERKAARDARYGARKAKKISYSTLMRT